MTADVLINTYLPENLKQYFTTVETLVSQMIATKPYRGKKGKVEKKKYRKYFYDIIQDIIDKAELENKTEA